MPSTMHKILHQLFKMSDERLDSSISQTSKYSFTKIQLKGYSRKNKKTEIFLVKYLCILRMLLQFLAYGLCNSPVDITILYFSSALISLDYNINLDYMEQIPSQRTEK